MVELSQAGDGLLRKGFAGDTFNTAWYARACLGPDWSVDYFTALGDDAMSDEMVAFIDKAGIGTSLIRQLQGEARMKDRPLRLSFVRGNRAAALYERLGFRHVGSDVTKIHMQWHA